MKRFLILLLLALSTGASAGQMVTIDNKPLNPVYTLGVDAQGNTVAGAGAVSQGAAGTEAWPVTGTTLVQMSKTLDDILAQGAGDHTVNQGDAGPDYWPVALGGFSPGSGNTEPIDEVDWAFNWNGQTATGRNSILAQAALKALDQNNTSQMLDLFSSYGALWVTPSEQVGQYFGQETQDNPFVGGLVDPDYKVQALQGVDLSAAPNLLVHTNNYAPTVSAMMSAYQSGDTFTTAYGLSSSSGSDGDGNYHQTLDSGLWFWGSTSNLLSPAQLSNGNPLDWGGTAGLYTPAMAAFSYGRYADGQAYPLQTTFSADPFDPNSVAQLMVSNDNKGWGGEGVSPAGAYSDQASGHDAETLFMPAIYSATAALDVTGTYNSANSLTQVSGQNIYGGMDEASLLIGTVFAQDSASHLVSLAGVALSEPAISDGANIGATTTAQVVINLNYVWNTDHWEKMTQP